MKINLGNSLFNRQQKIDELTEDNIHLTSRLKELSIKMENLVKINKSLRLEHNRVKDYSQLASLDYEKLRLGNTTLEGKYEKLVDEFEILKQKFENEKEKNFALSERGECLMDTNMEVESERDQLRVDIKRLEKKSELQNSEILDLKSCLKKAHKDIEILEKSLFQKDKHIQILLKEKEKRVKIKKDTFKEYLTDKLKVELREDKESTDAYIMDKNADLKNEIGLLREKIRNLKKVIIDKNEEVDKVKEDNFYLVTRLKNSRKKKR